MPPFGGIYFVLKLSDQVKDMTREEALSLEYDELKNPKEPAILLLPVCMPSLELPDFIEVVHSHLFPFQPFFSPILFKFFLQRIQVLFGSESDKPASLE